MRRLDQWDILIGRLMRNLYCAHRTILPFMSPMFSRTMKQLSLCPLARPSSGLTLATGLREQRAIGAAITKSDERLGYVASRA
jgi:hypothetical protein